MHNGKQAPQPQDEARRTGPSFMVGLIWTAAMLALAWRAFRIPHSSPPAGWLLYVAGAAALYTLAEWQRYR